MSVKSNFDILSTDIFGAMDMQRELKFCFYACIQPQYLENPNILEGFLHEISRFGCVSM